jgi:hypothetical protein
LINKENNSSKYKPVKYTVGDFVLYYNPKKIKEPLSTGSYKPQKLCWRWSMPYKVTKRIDEWTYEITDDKQTLEAPVNRLRVYNPWNGCCMDTSPWLEEQGLEADADDGEDVDENDGVNYDRIPKDGIPIGDLLIIPTTFDLQPFAVGRLMKRIISERDGRVLLTVQWYYNDLHQPEGKYYPGWRYKERGKWFEHYSTNRPRNSAIECKNDFENDTVEIIENTVCWHGFKLENKQIPTTILNNIKNSSYIEYP